MTSQAEHPPILKVDDVYFQYPDGTQPLDGVTFALQPRERVALLGPNGAGKTTLAHLLNGLSRPTKGTIEVAGVTVKAETADQVRQRVQLLFASSDEQLFMPTVAEDVAFGPSNLGLDPAAIEERTRAALVAVDAANLAEKAPHKLSTGEKKRAALAGILAMEPDLLVLDEPSAGLDPSGRRRLLTHLRSLDQAQLVITHDLPFAAELCPTSIILNQGKVSATGPTLELLADQDLLAANDLALPFGFSLPAV